MSYTVSPRLLGKKTNTNSGIKHDLFSSIAVKNQQNVKIAMELESRCED